MEIETDYATKVFFPTSSFIQVYFEAVANAFDAGASEIAIHIRTDPLEVTISDNGQGFSDDRFEHFARLKEPRDQYHKGIGRLVFLKYFESVEVDSIFDRMRRAFTFSRAFDGKAPTTVAPESDLQRTTLRFRAFQGARLQTNNYIRPSVLKRRLLDEFMPLLHNKKRKEHRFCISIRLDTGNRDLFEDPVFIKPTDVPDLACKVFRDPFRLFSTEIEMFYEIRRGNGARLTAACIDGRAIPIDLLGQNAVPPDYSYTFLFESEFFAGKSDSTRQTLALPKDMPEAVLFRLLRKQIGAALNETITEISEKNASTRGRLEEQFPHLTGLFDEETVGLVDKDEAIDGAQRTFFKAQKEILESSSLDDATFEKSLELSARTLTEYILYRELIIKKLSSMTPENTEADIHNLIVPQRIQFHSDALVDGIYNNNAWLLDDKFMSFQTILSEARMRELIAVVVPGANVNDETRPDISMIFSADPTHAAGVDVVVVELKRRVSDAKENTFAGMQLVQRARRLANYYHAIQRIWYFAVIEIDEELSQLLMSDDYTPLFSRGRHVYYREFRVKRADGLTVPTPVCLLSFDAIIKDAAARNHTFLEILKSAFKRTKTSAEQAQGPAPVTSRPQTPLVTRAPMVELSAPTEAAESTGGAPRRRRRGEF